MRALLLILLLTTTAFGVLPQAPPLPQAPKATTCDCEQTRVCKCYADACVCPACLQPPNVAPAAKAGPLYNASHTCPNCHYTSPAGTGTWIVRGYVAGGHVHSCPNCGQQWFH